MMHLTHTGYYAGHLLCERPRESTGEYAHAVYAPLTNDGFRAHVCPDCLRVYATEAYEPGDDMPAWVQPYHGTAP